MLRGRAPWGIFYAHGHSKELCQQRLTNARRASRGKAFSLLDCETGREETFPARLSVDKKGGRSL